MIFLALVPHRDVRLSLRNYSASLFRSGFAGAFHFPWAAPLASLSRPLNTEELKLCARAIRQAEGGGKINSEEAAAIPFCENTLLYGPRLQLALPQEALGAEKTLRVFSAPVIGTLLMHSGESHDDIPPPPKLSFRAAAVANMFWQTMYTTDRQTICGCKWKIGKLCWLAPVKDKA